MGEAKGRQEADETGGAGGDPTRGLSRHLEGGGVVLPAVKKKSTFREYAEALIIAIILALFIRTFVVQAFKIPSGSMIETLTVGDHILVNKFLYGVKIPFTDEILIPVGKPRRGDVIVFKYPQDESKDFIKRVIGEPGDVVEIRNKQVYVNQKSLDEPYAIHQDAVVYTREAQPRDYYGPITVPQDSYFVMGDNRDHSMDSRYWGFVKLNKIKGKAFLIYWSWDKSHYWVRWKRIAHAIH
jgi:signal peptidase I